MTFPIAKGTFETFYDQFHIHGYFETIIFIHGSEQKLLASETTKELSDLQDINVIYFHIIHQSKVSRVPL